AISEMEQLVRGNSSRRDVVETVERLRRWYAANAEVPQVEYDGVRTTGDPPAPNQEAAFYAAQALDDHLVSFTVGCVPGGWLDANNRASSICDETRLLLGSEVYADPNGRPWHQDRDLLAMTSRTRELGVIESELEQRVTELRVVAQTAGTPEARVDALLAGLQHEAAQRELDMLAWESNLKSIEIRRGSEYLNANYQAEIRASQIARERYESMRILTDALASESTLSNEERGLLARRVLLEVNGAPASDVVTRLTAEIRAAAAADDRNAGYAAQALAQLEGEQGRLATLLGVLDANGEILRSFEAAVGDGRSAADMAREAARVQQGATALTGAVEDVLDSATGAQPAVGATCSASRVNALCKGARASVLPMCQTCGHLIDNGANQALTGNGG
ncbi:MAG: hypothetical protein AAF202_03595, partial [Pseudomonadota bacterium]